MKSKDNVVALHRSTSNRDFDWNNFKILDRETSSNKRLISKMLHINLQRNSINKKEDTLKLNSRYKQFLKK